MSKVLITGASGFVGQRIHQLIERSGNHSVYGVSRSMKPDPSLPYFSLEDSESILKTLAFSKPDVVIHLAAIAGITSDNPLKFYEVNALGTERLLAALDKLGLQTRFIFVSTAGVYGPQPVELLSEDLGANAVHHYGHSKYIAEKMCHMAATRHDITIFRPFNVVGPYQNNSFVVAKIIHHYNIRHSSIRLGNIDTIRDYIDVQTVAETIVSAIHEPSTHNEIINICSGAGTTVRNLIDLLFDLTGFRLHVEQDPGLFRENEIQSLVGSTRKLDQLLPHRPVSADVDRLLWDLIRVSRSERRSPAA